MKKFLIILLVLACLIIPVLGETFDGSLEAPSTGVYTNYVGAYGGYNVGGSFHNLSLGNTQASGGLNSWVYWENNVGSISSFSWSPILGNNVSGQTPFMAYIGGQYVGSGMIGFQRLFGFLGIEQPGYMYLTFNDWNQQAFSGTKLVNLTYNDFDIWNLTPSQYSGGGSLPTKAYLNTAAGNCGSFTISTVYPFYNEFSITQPSGLGTAGYLLKYQLQANNISKVYYPSKGFLVNHSSQAILASDATVNNLNLNFTFITASPLDLDVIDANGNWYNKSFAFNLTLPTPTPTPYPTITQSPIPNGYVRTNFIFRDSQTQGRISGLSVSIKDNLNSTWKNSTTNANGSASIDTLPNDNVNLYVPETDVYWSMGSQNLSTRTSADLPTQGPVLDYNEVMFAKNPLVTAGNVSYSVNPVDTSNQNLINDALIIIDYGNYHQTAYSTGGSATFILPVNTDLTITGSKTGYGSGTVKINSGPTVVNSTLLNMAPITPTPTPTRTGVIPTRTVITGNVTPIPTTTPLQYNGFWAPIADAFSTMGALPTEIGMLLAFLFIFCGVVVGGWASAPYGASAFNNGGAVIGGIFGFILSVAFGFVPFVYVVAAIMIIVVGLIMFSRG